MTTKELFRGWTSFVAFLDNLRDATLRRAVAHAFTSLGETKVNPVATGPVYCEAQDSQLEARKMVSKVAASVAAPLEMELRLFVPHVVDPHGIPQGEPRFEQFIAGTWRPIPLVYEDPMAGFARRSVSELPGRRPHLRADSDQGRRQGLGRSPTAGGGGSELIRWFAGQHLVTVATHSLIGGLVLSALEAVGWIRFGHEALLLAIVPIVAWAALRWRIERK